MMATTIMISTKVNPPLIRAFSFISKSYCVARRTGHC
jgi:hypothetical protein